jgi:hypothetical protein
MTSSFLERGLMGSMKETSVGTTFGPETIEDLTTAFERIRRVLKLKDPDDPLIEVVAKKVVSLASQGTLDPKEIECLVIANTKRTEA